MLQISRPELREVIESLKLLHFCNDYDLTSGFGFVLQLKNAESILEYERMAEIGFDKRDFRMVRERRVGEYNNLTDVKMLLQQCSYCR